jgi:hypothetical protein
MTTKNSLEDILGTPEEYQAAQKKAADEWAAVCARYRGKLLQESHAKFESQLPAEKLNPKGMYDHDTAMQWNGWQACMDFTPRLKFGHMEIVLPQDPMQRQDALDDFNNMIRAYMNAMCRTWGTQHVRMDSIFTDVEKAMAHAKVVLDGMDYSVLKMGIVDHGGRAEHRRYKEAK